MLQPLLSQATSMSVAIHEHQRAWHSQIAEECAWLLAAHAISETCGIELRGRKQMEVEESEERNSVGAFWSMWNVHILGRQLIEGAASTRFQRIVFARTFEGQRLLRKMEQHAVIAQQRAEEEVTELHARDEIQSEEDAAYEVSQQSLSLYRMFLGILINVTVQESEERAALLRRMYSYFETTLCIDAVHIQEALHREVLQSYWIHELQLVFLERNVAIQEAREAKTHRRRQVEEARRIERRPQQRISHKERMQRFWSCNPEAPTLLPTITDTYDESADKTEATCEMVAEAAKVVSLSQPPHNVVFFPARVPDALRHFIAVQGTPPVPPGSVADDHFPPSATSFRSAEEEYFAKIAQHPEAPPKEKLYLLLPAVRRHHCSLVQSFVRSRLAWIEKERRFFKINRRPIRFMQILSKFRFLFPRLLRRRHAQLNALLHDRIFFNRTIGCVEVKPVDCSRNSEQPLTRLCQSLPQTAMPVSAAIKLVARRCQRCLPIFLALNALLTHVTTNAPDEEHHCITVGIVDNTTSPPQQQRRISISFAVLARFGDVMCSLCRAELFACHGVANEDLYTTTQTQRYKNIFAFPKVCREYVNHLPALRTITQMQAILRSWRAHRICVLREETFFSRYAFQGASVLHRIRALQVQWRYRILCKKKRGSSLAERRDCTGSIGIEMLRRILSSQRCHVAHEGTRWHLETLKRRYIGLVKKCGSSCACPNQCPREFFAALRGHERARNLLRCVTARWSTFVRGRNCLRRAAEELTRDGSTFCSVRCLMLFTMAMKYLASHPAAQQKRSFQVFSALMCKSNYYCHNCLLKAIEEARRRCDTAEFVRLRFFFVIDTRKLRAANLLRRERYLNEIFKHESCQTQLKTDPLVLLPTHWMAPNLVPIAPRLCDRCLLFAAELQKLLLCHPTFENTRLLRFVQLMCRSCQRLAMTLMQPYLFERRIAWFVAQRCRWVRRMKRQANLKPLKPSQDTVPQPSCLRCTPIFQVLQRRLDQLAETPMTAAQTQRFISWMCPECQQRGMDFITAYRTTYLTNVSRVRSQPSVFRLVLVQAMLRGLWSYRRCVHQARRRNVKRKNAKQGQLTVAHRTSPCKQGVEKPADTPTPALQSPPTISVTIKGTECPECRAVVGFNSDWCHHCGALAAHCRNPLIGSKEGNTRQVASALDLLRKKRSEARRHPSNSKVPMALPEPVVLPSLVSTRDNASPPAAPSAFDSMTLLDTPHVT